MPRYSHIKSHDAYVENKPDALSVLLNACFFKAQPFRPSTYTEDTQLKLDGINEFFIRCMGVLKRILRFIAIHVRYQIDGKDIMLVLCEPYYGKNHFEPSSRPPFAVIDHSKPDPNAPYTKWGRDVTGKWDWLFTLIKGGLKSENATKEKPHYVYEVSREDIMPIVDKVWNEFLSVDFDLSYIRPVFESSQYPGAQLRWHVDSRLEVNHPKLILFIKPEALLRDDKCIKHEMDYGITIEKVLNEFPMLKPHMFEDILLTHA